MFFFALALEDFMAKKFESGESYAGRRADVAVINCSVDREAATLGLQAFLAENLL